MSTHRLCYRDKGAESRVLPGASGDEDQLEVADKANDCLTVIRALKAVLVSLRLTRPPPP